MAVDRPTFSENWHRVAGLRLRLRPAVRSFRQQFRGRLWHVLADPADNQFFRLDEAGYHFVGLLDGRRTVAEAWRLCHEDLGDAAPTQGEAIGLLGQLYTSNLLRGELPPDAEGMFERQRKRRRREVGSQLMNFLFVRVPLVDPNRLLHRWVGWFGWAFGPVGLAMWFGLLAAAGWSLAGRWDELVRGADPQVLLRSENLLLLYLCFAAIKALHELGHGFACVHFGQKAGVGGPVHVMGIMLLVFMPVPYVDATSSWALRSKWQRAFVGAAGMYVELAVAAAAAIVWAHTAEGTLTHAIACNLILIASVSTLLFNGNPLLRFDGYYILSDLLETPNLAQRSRQYLYYLVRRYVYGVWRAHSPAQGGGERLWLAAYAIASTIYRVLICIAILLYVADVLFVLGALMAVAAIVTWVFVPAGRFVRYLGTSPELARVRGRAVLATVVVLGSVVGFIAMAPVPQRGRAEGVVEPVAMAEVRMPADGIVRAVLASHRRVKPGGQPLLRADNERLSAERRQLRARLRELSIRRGQARAEDQTAVVQALSERIEAVRQRLATVEQQIRSLTIESPLGGVWVGPEAERLAGAYLRRGRRLGMVADPSRLIVRAVAGQDLGPLIASHAGRDVDVELRVRGRPEIHLRGEILSVLPAGRSRLPSAALGYLAGGSLAVDSADPQGTRTAEPFFEVRIRPDLAPHELRWDRQPTLRIGQRVVARFTFGRRPLLQQWTRSLRQLIQRRFSTPG